MAVWRLSRAPLANVGDAARPKAAPARKLATHACRCARVRRRRQRLRADAAAANTNTGPELVSSLNTKPQPKPSHSNYCGTRKGCDCACAAPVASGGAQCSRGRPMRPPPRATLRCAHQTPNWPQTKVTHLPAPATTTTATATTTTTTKQRQKPQQQKTQLHNVIYTSLIILTQLTCHHMHSINGFSLYHSTDYDRAHAFDGRADGWRADAATDLPATLAPVSWTLATQPTQHPRPHQSHHIQHHHNQHQHHHHHHRPHPQPHPHYHYDRDHEQSLRRRRQRRRSSSAAAAAASRLLIGDDAYLSNTSSITGTGINENGIGDGVNNSSSSSSGSSLHQNSIASLNNLLTVQHLLSGNKSSTVAQQSGHTLGDINFINNVTDKYLSPGAAGSASQASSSSQISATSINGTMLASASAAAAASDVDSNEFSMAEEESDTSLVVTSSIVANSIIFIIGLCGNLVVILVILKFTRVETVTDIYILNLAFADLMFIAGLFFLVITMYLGEWIFGHTMCKIYMATTSLNQFASSLLLVIMSFDRFLAVCHPIYAQQFRNPRRAKIICMIIWIICLTLMLPIFIFAKAQDGASCSIHWPEYPGFNCEVAFTLYSFAIGFAVPLSLIACFYVCVIRKLRMAASEPITMSRSSRRSRARESTNKRIEHLVIAIIFTYTICWLPYWITQLYVSFTTNNDESQPVQGFYEFFLLATSLTYTNSALNPILYAFLSDNFKRRFSDILRSIYSIKWCREEIVTETHSTVMSALA